VSRVQAVVVAAGRGERFGKPKAFVELAGRPLAAWAVQACRAVADRVVLVVPEGSDADLLAVIAPDVTVIGGSTRSASVRAGLAAVSDDALVVVVHDAARPLATPALFHAVLEAVLSEGVDGAVCAVPVVDTIKRVAPEGASFARVLGTLDRSELVAVQTPQMFRAAMLRQAHAAGAEATDDAALVEELGASVVAVPGDPANLKVTTPDDLALAERLLAR
jgi:2-C-methyl-D-erythritol 4-phosphate cytidylyltransferase